MLSRINLVPFESGIGRNEEYGNTQPKENEP